MRKLVRFTVKAVLTLGLSFLGGYVEERGRRLAKDVEDLDVRETFGTLGAHIAGRAAQFAMARAMRTETKPREEQVKRRPVRDAPQA